MLAKYITAETLKRVAAAYDDNRMLFVGTTNIDYGQTWVWNMTLIAKAGDLELYRKVLLASASFPIVFPPVEIDGHLFVDGAARSNVVVPGMGGTRKPNPPLYGPGNLYLIDNGRVTQPPECLTPGPWRRRGDNDQRDDGTVDANSSDKVLLRDKDTRLLLQDGWDSGRRRYRQ